MIKLLFALIAIAGYIANINDRKELSYWLWPASNIYWLFYNLYKQEYQLMLMFTAYTVFCLYGLSKELNK